MHAEANGHPHMLAGPRWHNYVCTGYVELHVLNLYNYTHMNRNEITSTIIGMHHTLQI